MHLGLFRLNWNQCSRAGGSPGWLSLNRTDSRQDSLAAFPDLDTAHGQPHSRAHDRARSHVQLLLGLSHIDAARLVI